MFKVSTAVVPYSGIARIAWPKSQVPRAHAQAGPPGLATPLIPCNIKFCVNFIQQMISQLDTPASNVIGQYVTTGIYQ